MVKYNNTMFSKYIDHTLTCKYILPMEVLEDDTIPFRMLPHGSFSIGLMTSLFLSENIESVTVCLSLTDHVTMPIA